MGFFENVFKRFKRGRGAKWGNKIPYRVNFRYIPPGNAVKYYRFRNWGRTLRRLVFVVFIVGVAGIALLSFLDILLFVRTGQGYWWVSQYLARVSYNKNQQEAVGFVNGLEEEHVVVFPGSSFLFDGVELNESERQEVIKFLNYKNSIYILKNRTVPIDLQGIGEYYKKHLPAFGYQFVGKKDIDDENGFKGIYFVHKSKQIGLRIYTLTGYDIWYEIISPVQAKTYLKDKVVKILTRQARLSAGRQELDKKYKLALIVPRGVQVNALYIAGLDTYTLQFLDAQDKLILQIIPYKPLKEGQDEIAIEKLESEAKNILKEYLARSGVVINLGESLKFDKVQMPRLFDRTQENKVDVLTLIEILQGKVDIKQLEEYQTTWGYRLTYKTINGQTKSIFLVKGAGLWWVLVW